MGTPYMSEIKIVAFNFAPKGWAQCNGQFLPINQNQALFSLLGTTYGGNGQTTFALPNLQGQVPLHVGGSFNVQGQAGGEESHTLSVSEMPMHIHSANASTAVATTNIPGNTLVLAQSTSSQLYTGAANAVAMAANAIGNTGGSQAHENRQPYLVLLFCIALQGVFPSRN
jgi:microcystin-dependent protein